MCLAVYLGSSQELPEIDWVEAAPAFYVEKLRPEDGAVRVQFKLPYVYYVGSHQGCGCGFLKDGEVGEELERANENYTGLAHYLRAAMESGASTELFSCWEGDQEQVPDFNERVTPSQLEFPEYEFKERHLAKVEAKDA